VKEMKPEIHQLSLRMINDNCYLIKEDGVIMVDASMPKQGKKFLKWLGDLSINPEDISLLLLTHGHLDHVGSASEFKKLTGCKVAINHREKDCVEKALKSLPPGVNLWGKVYAAIGNALLPFINFPSTRVDLPLEDEDYSLEPYGIHGRVIHTPGHTYGSMSLLLDTGDAFVGDLAVNPLPMRIALGMPQVAENANAVKESWRLLLSSGAKHIYPAHGKPFSADALERLL
jgi:glyoxylase-like metal-dependent hydrolase (beta-lactamase superfamily II)